MLNKASPFGRWCRGWCAASRRRTGGRGSRCCRQRVLYIYIYILYNY